MKREQTLGSWILVSALVFMQRGALMICTRGASDDMQPAVDDMHAEGVMIYKAYALMICNALR